MNELLAIIDKLQPTRPIFTITFDRSDPWNTFSREPKFPKSLPEPTNHLEALVYMHYNERFSDGKFTINKSHILSNVNASIFHFVKNVYVKHKGVLEFGRTKLYRQFERAGYGNRNQEFTCDMFALYQLCVKEGLGSENALHHSAAKYVSLQFKSLGEKYGKA